MAGNGGNLVAMVAKQLASAMVAIMALMLQIGCVLHMVDWLFWQFGGVCLAAWYAVLGTPNWTCVVM